MLSRPSAVVLGAAVLSVGLFAARRLLNPARGRFTPLTSEQQAFVDAAAGASTSAVGVTVTKESTG